MRIDWWTLALQTVNVLVLIWILSRFFFRPVAAIIAKRQDAANQLLTEAAAANRAADDALAKADKARAEIGAERDRLIAEARASAQDEKAALLGQASQEIEKLRSEADAAIARDRGAASEAIVTHASDLSVEIAQRLLGRFPSRSVLSAFLDGLGQQLNALPLDAKRSIIAASTAGDPIEIVTATALSQEETDRVRELLRAAFASELPVSFRNDPQVDCRYRVPQSQHGCA